MTHHLPRIPNQRLKQARLGRGWSQRLFIQQIDQQAVRMGYVSALPDPRTIRRWESGQSRPSPFYQTILCALLDQEPEALGFLPAAPAADQSESRTVGHVQLLEERLSSEGHLLLSGPPGSEVPLVPYALVFFLPKREDPSS